MTEKKKPRFRLSKEEEAKRDAELREEIEQIPDRFIAEYVDPLYEKLPDITQNELTAFNNVWMSELTEVQRKTVQLLRDRQVNAIRLATSSYEDEEGRYVVYTNRFDEELYELAPIPEHQICDEVLTGLSRSKKINLYVRGDRLGRVVKAEGLFKWDQVPKEGIGKLISEGCAIVTYKQDKKTEELKLELQVPTPRYIREGIIGYQDYSQLRELRTIYTYPYVYDNQLVTKSGYNVKSKIYMPKLEELELVYPDNSEEAVALLRHLLSGFRFRNESDFENAIALALTPIIRPNIPAGVPLFCITAPSHGSGKSFLCQTLWSILQGSAPGVTDLENNQEMEKKLFSVISDAKPYVIFDNVESHKPLDSGLLASFVTEPRRTARIFHTQKTTTIENFTIACYTGTSTEASMELVDRIAAIRLEAPRDRNAKVYYEFDPIVDEIIPEQGKYLGALMFMVQKWIDAGCPKIDGSKDGSERVHRQRHWAGQIHGILDINGLGKHFLANDGEMRLDSSPEDVEMSRFLKEIVRQLGPEIAMDKWQTKDIFHIASYKDDDQVTDNYGPSNMLSRWVDPKKYNHEAARKAEVGRVLNRFKDKPFGGWIIQKAGIYQGATQFKLVDVGGLEKYNELQKEHQQNLMQKDLPEQDDQVTRIDEQELEMIRAEREAIMNELNEDNDDQEEDDWKF